jgi:hypothetical protein
MVVGLAMIGVFLAPFESLLPDVHDIGSTKSVETSFDQDIRAADLASVVADQPINPHSDQTSGHRFHVDHCSHAHCLSLGVSRIAVSVGDVRGLAVETNGPQLSGVTLSPLHRPPIA